MYAAHLCRRDRDRDPRPVHRGIGRYHAGEYGQHPSVAVQPAELAVAHLVQRRR